MVFESFIEANSLLLWATFAIALVMGAAVNKTNFCTMGAVSDVVNMGDWGRMRAWLFAIAVALLGVTVLEASGMLTLSQTFPPYRGGSLAWVENLLGGLIFGVGMTLASGCGNKCLIRIGGGNIKSVMVLAIIAVIAYFMTNPLPGSDNTLYSLLFYGWTNPMAINLVSGQDLGSVLVSADGAASARIWIGAVLAIAVLAFVWKSAAFRGSVDNILGGLVVGLAVLTFWYVSSNLKLDIDGEMMNLSSYYSQWDFLAESDDGKPATGAPLATQSFTFINPMGQTLGYVASGFSSALLTAGVMALFGVIAGSFLWSVVTRGFRVEWFSSAGDFFSHFIGAIMMGIGGVLAMGCTIGQGITGVSSLAVGSFMTLFAIVLGSALTMKVQYYKLVYEEEAGFVKALIAGLCDLRLLPNGMRRLEKI